MSGHRGIWVNPAMVSGGDAGEAESAAVPAPGRLARNDVSGGLIVPHLSCVSRRGGRTDVGGAGRRNHLAAGKDLAHVVKHDHSVAQQAPSLLGVKGDGVGGIAIPVVSRGARGSVWTNRVPLVRGVRMYLADPGAGARGDAHWLSVPALALRPRARRVAAAFAAAAFRFCWGCTPS
jgi:hypothetical protein